MSCIRNLGISLVMVFSLTCVTEALALPFSNGDFSSGFDRWQGSLSGVIVDPTSSALFSIVGSQANILSDLVEFPVTLFQDFELGTETSISLNYRWNPTGVDDLFNAILMQTGGNNDSIDLLGTNTSNTAGQVVADVSALSGQAVRLYFTVIDWSFDSNIFVADTLTVGTIEFSGTNSSPVPEPSTILLLGAGLAGLAFCRKKAIA